MLESTVKPLKEAGWRPVAAFDAVTVFNIVFALLLATLLFSGFEIPTSYWWGREAGRNREIAARLLPGVAGQDDA